MPPVPPPNASTATASVASAGSIVRCFSFGANMAPSTLAKRGVQPLASEPAIVENAAWTLSFSHRGGYATLQEQQQQGAPGPAPGPSWRAPHGVLYTLTAADLQRLAAREVGYFLAQLPILTYSQEPCIAAVFLSAPLLQLYRPVPPPKRYHALLLEGARHHGLSADYVHWLEGLEAAPPGPLDGRYDACPAQSLAQLLAVGALGAVALASARM